MSAEGYGRKPARIGFLNFTYADPAINVDTEQRTVEHETIDDTTVVQTIGRKPDSISIDGVVTESELVTVDNLTTQGVIELRTERWSGDVIVESTSTSFKRARNEFGLWLYDVTIECVEVDERTTTDKLIDVGIIADDIIDYSGGAGVGSIDF
jgi:hypothetical protein